MSDAPEEFSVPASKVQWKRRWSDDWLEMGDLQAVSAETCLMPSRSAASFRWRYGSLASGGDDYSSVAPLRDMADSYVLISIFDDNTGEWKPVWCGVLTDPATRIGGPPGLIAITPTGDQELQAFGMEELLCRAAVDGSWIWSAETLVRIDNPMPFNLRDPSAKKFTGPRAELIGNRSADKATLPNGKQCYVFSTSGKLWTGQDILEYLLAAFGPDRIDFDLTILGQAITPGTSADATALSDIVRVIEPPATVADGITAVAARQRGLAWHVETFFGDAPTILIDSVSSVDIVSGPAKLPANASNWSADLADGRRESVVINRSTSHVYDRIVARGGPVVACGTLSKQFGNLVKVWTDAQETAYRAAPDGPEGRDREGFDDVFATFRLPTGAANLFDTGIIPTVKPDGRLDPLNPAKPPFALGRTLLKELPLLAGYDYSQDPPVDVDSGSRKEFLPPIAWCLFAANNTRYRLDKLAETVKGAPNIGLKILSGEMGFTLKCRPNHLFALNHWADAEASAYAPVFDYADLIATVAVATDQRLQVVEDLPTYYTADAPRTLVINVPDAEAWWLAGSTFLGTDSEGEYIFAPAAGVELRNDRERLAAVAAFAKSWFSRPRKAVQIGWKNLMVDMLVGTILSSVRCATENFICDTIVSRIRWDFDEARTTLQSDFSELDFVDLSGPASGQSSAIGQWSMSAPARRDLAADSMVRPPLPSVRQGQAFLVLVENDGGIAGGEDDDCTFTYTVKGLDGQTMKKNAAGDPAEEMTPELLRLEKIEYEAAATDSLALACYDGQYLKLLVCFLERPKASTC